MYNYFQKLFQEISQDYIKKWIETNFKLCDLPTLIGFGGYMLTQHILGSVILFVAVFIIIRRIRNIDGKLIIFPDFLYQVITDQNKCNLSIVLQIYNCSNQIISCIIDEEKTKLIVNEKTKPKFQYTKTDQLLVPYHLFCVSTDSIEFDLKIENILDKRIQINAEIHLKYGFKGNENYITSIKIENFVKLVRIGDNNIIAIPLPPNSPIKLPA